MVHVGNAALRLALYASITISAMLMLLIVTPNTLPTAWIARSKEAWGLAIGVYLFTQVLPHFLPHSAPALYLMQRCTACLPAIVSIVAQGGSQKWSYWEYVIAQQSWVPAIVAIVLAWGVLAQRRSPARSDR